VGEQIISLNLTLQKYNIGIAVHECWRKKIMRFLGLFLFGGVVIWSFVICQNRKHTVKIRHYNINIYIYIYSEQITAFPIRK
jgi:hypothetical protein